MVEVTAPDGGKSLWVAAVAKARAVAAVTGVLPANYVARTLTATANAYPEGGCTSARRSAEGQAMNQPKRPDHPRGRRSRLPHHRREGRIVQLS